MSDTIAAISTSPGIGGIGIIRMSGEDCFQILEKIFKPKNKQSIEKIKGYTMKFGKIVDKDNIIDEVLVSYFKSPKSYTSENMCEINSHGGIVIMNKILDLCIKNGANLAEPGEFTKRAFLNGRIDLSQAEAVIDIINAKTDKEAEVSLKQLEGSLSEKIEKIRKIVISVMADIEATIDYPEYDLEEVTNAKIIKVLDEVDILLKSLEKSFYNGKILREGISTAIIGRPNAGKSSLLNLILNEERAIVTDIEGTTRDTIEEFISIDGIPLKIIDTAGIRNAKDEVEKIGVEKAMDIAKRSDIIIAIFDSSKKLNEEDKKILELLKDKNAIILLNKIDLEKIIKVDEFKEINKPVIEISTKTKEGIDKLYEEISKMFKLKEIANDGETIVSNVRHKNIIINSRRNLEKARETINNNMPIDIISTYLKEIIEELGKITGETVTDDVITEIFSKFCLGK
ncbi:MAG TPA: tRNA uridine-5-carboxymethylaminomethyl(34) synthesis GTPase MnmE [Candidatus Scatovivens faecipullorum]|nr:tRNA uridine-5-carboxymethylaminomethyl(34) synthesis GTPase MnmE [Candidatus Scatovivens faecipullorum]